MNSDIPNKVSDKASIQIGIHDEKVIMDFGTKVTCMVLTAEQAIAIGKLLIKKAKKVR